MPIAAASTNDTPKRYNEYNSPAGVYVPGDPLPLNRDNMKDGKRIAFVACPYVRDSEPTPLWLADYEGETYFLRAQQNTSVRVDHPQLKHKVLVEAVISSEARISGGVVLNPLLLSVLPELDPNCERMLPADGSRVEYAKRPPGPGASGATRHGNAARRTANAERLWAESYTPDPIERVTKVFTFPFTFDNPISFEPRQYTLVLEAVKYARDVEASSVEIVGHRGSVLLSSGAVMIERLGIAEERAAGIKAIFEDHPFAPGIVIARGDPDVPKANGVSDFEQRYVSVTVRPGGSKTKVDK